MANCYINYEMTDIRFMYSTANGNATEATRLYRVRSSMRKHIELCAEMNGRHIERLL